MYYRFLEHESTQFITVNENEKVLRQLHENAVKTRIHHQHSFIRSNSGFIADTPNQFIIFPDKRISVAPKNSLIIQFIPTDVEPVGNVVWIGEK